MVSQFYMVAKTAGMFELTNVICRDALDAFMKTLREVLDEEHHASLIVASDCVFFNETRLKMDFEGFTSFKFVIDSFKAREIGAIVIAEDVTRDGFESFIKLFTENDARVEDPRGRITSGLREAGIETFRVDEPRELPTEVTSRKSVTKEDHRGSSVNTYFKSIFVAKQFLENFRGNQSSYVRKAKRVVHNIVDLVAEDDSTLLALTQIKNFDDFLFTHSANVCILSVVLGQQLGLDKVLLSNLGLAGLLHDVGMTEIPKEILGRIDQLDPDEEALYNRHPALGARTVLRTQGISDSSIRCMMVAYEHHIQNDYSGFPSVQERRPHSLLSRIVALTDFYDSITTPYVEGEGGFASDEALKLISRGTEGVFDPVLVKVFINTLGTYPVGSLVRLNTGEIGFVHKKNVLTNDHNRPIVKIIADKEGKTLEEPIIVDLTDRAEGSGRYKRTIVESVAPTMYFEEMQSFTELL